jgi:hypothetical protein
LRNNNKQRIQQPPLPRLRTLDDDSEDEDEMAEDASTDDDDDSIPDMLTHVPDYQLNTRQFSYGTGANRLKTMALAIEGAAKDENRLHEIFWAARTQQWLPRKTIYVPRAIAHSVGDDTYENAIKTQLHLISETVVIPVWGITPTALDTPIENNKGEKIRLRTEILNQQSIDRVEATLETTNNGKWFFVTNKQMANSARKFIDTVLPIYYKQLTKFQTSVVPGRPGPSRGEHRHGDMAHLEDIAADL